MSSAASISAAKRRRGPQPSMQPPPQTRGKPQQNSSTPSQSQGQRINPMAILKDHEMRLREIEKNPSEDTENKLGVSKSVDNVDERVDVLVQENVTLNKKVDILKDKIIALEKSVAELSKLKDIVFHLQSSVILNTQKVNSINTTNATTGEEVDKSVVTKEVIQEIEDVTQSMSHATVNYGDDVDKPSSNVTFTVVENDNKEQLGESDE